MKDLRQTYEDQLKSLMLDAQRGKPVWRRQDILTSGLPLRAISGEPFRGIDVLLLWDALGLEPGTQSRWSRVVESHRPYRTWRYEGATRPPPVLIEQDIKGSHFVAYSQGFPVHPPPEFPLDPVVRRVGEALSGSEGAWNKARRLIEEHLDIPHVLTELSPGLALTAELATSWLIARWQLRPPRAALLTRRGLGGLTQAELFQACVSAQRVLDRVATAFEAALPPDGSQGLTTEALLTEVGGRQEVAGLMAPSLCEMNPIDGTPRFPAHLLDAPARGRAQGFANVRRDLQLSRGKVSHLSVTEATRHLVGFAHDAPTPSWRQEHLLDLEHLEATSLPAAWRRLGRRLREALSDPKRGTLTPYWSVDDASRRWKILRRSHLRSTWMHLHPQLHYANLLGDKRWDRSVLVPRLRAVETDDDWRLADIPLSRLSLTQLGAALRPSSKPKFDEGRFQGALVFGDESRPARRRRSTAIQRVLLAHVSRDAESGYTRRPLAKAGGGQRWLDVPSPNLMRMQRLIHQLLLERFPINGAAAAFLPHRGVPYHARAHAGCTAAVVIDIKDFFGSVRPHHISPWIGLEESTPIWARWPTDELLPGWSAQLRQQVMDRLFIHREGGAPYLPQGAPSSPIAANLAACRMDYRVIAKARAAFGEGAFAYTRYADDLVLSTRRTNDLSGFLKAAEAILKDAIRRMGWRPHPTKQRRWQRGDGPLVLCGAVLPEDPSAPLELPRAMRRRVRAAMHQLRDRRLYARDRERGPEEAHGLMAWAYAITGDHAYLAYTSPVLKNLARDLAGPVLSESFLLGWSDGVDKLPASDAS